MPQRLFLQLWCLGSVVVTWVYCSICPRIKLVPSWAAAGLLTTGPPGKSLSLSLLSTTLSEELVVVSLLSVEKVLFNFWFDEFFYQVHRELNAFSSINSDVDHVFFVFWENLTWYLIIVYIIPFTHCLICFAIIFCWGFLCLCSWELSVCSFSFL